MDEIKAVACNYRYSTKICPQAAKAFVLGTNPGNGSDHILIVARSRGGRWVEKYEDSRYLEHFRIVTLVECRAPYSVVKARGYIRDAEAWCAAMNAGQFYGAGRPLGPDSGARDGPRRAHRASPIHHPHGISASGRA